MNQDIGLHDSLDPGVLTAQCSEDIGLITRSVEFATTKKCNLAGTFFTMLIICFSFSWRMAMVLIVVSFFIVGTSSLAKAWWHQKKAEELSLEARLVSEAVGSARTVAALQVKPT